MKKFFHILLILITTGIAGAQQTLPYSTQDYIPQLGMPAIRPLKSYPIALNMQDVRQLLATAPDENAGSPGLHIALPDPDGNLQDFEVFSYELLPHALAEKFPLISTFWGQGLSNPFLRLRLDVTYQGFHAQVLSPTDDWYIDPAYLNDDRYYHAYYKKDLHNIHLQDWFCHAQADLPEEHEPLGTDSQSPIGSTLKKYRLAVAATGEYTQYHGGTVNSGMSAITTAINRVNGIYESELSVRLTLIANNDQLVFTNASTDPYSNNDGSAMLSQNQSTLNQIIGSSNYDIGHVFSTGGGGIAMLGSVCSNSYKAQGVTGLPNPIGDAFYVDYVCHEMGHQFNGNHTFNSNSGSCQGNRSSMNAYEPGSGSTIMAYAGICSPDNVQNNSDPYFHARSFVTIRTFLNGNGNSCATSTSTGNTPPVVTVPATKTMPASTPFKLKASGSDANGDPITYCWEEYDRGSSIPLASTPTSGTVPLFRSFKPDTSPTRYFPRLAVVVNNASVNTEKLPTYTRAMTFRVTVRDNKANGGGSSYAELALQVSANAGPFTVTSPNSAAELWTVGLPATVTWNVANTNQSPVNCQKVNIRLSIDGGLSFPYLILADTPNDGSETFVLPQLPGAPLVLLNQCRVMVEAADNYFYNVSSDNFSVNNILGTEEEMAASLIPYPNPSQDGIFRLPATGLQLQVMDLSGRILEVPVRTYSDYVEIDLSQNPSGVYFLRTTGGKSWSLLRL